MEENKKEEQSTLQYVSPEVMKTIQELANKLAEVSNFYRTYPRNFSYNIMQTLARLDAGMRYVCQMIEMRTIGGLPASANSYQSPSPNWRHPASNPGVAPDINPFTALRKNSPFQQNADLIHRFTPELKGDDSKIITDMNEIVSRVRSAFKEYYSDIMNMPTIPQEAKSQIFGKWHYMSISHNELVDKAMSKIIRPQDTDQRITEKAIIDAVCAVAAEEHLNVAFY